MKKSHIILLSQVLIIVAALFIPDVIFEELGDKFMFGVLAAFLVPALLIKCSFRYARIYSINRKYSNVLSSDELRNKVRQFIREHEFILEEEIVGEHGCYFNIKIPMNIWSYGNCLEMIVFDRNLFLSSRNKYSFQLVDYNVTNKNVTDALLLSLEKKS